MARTGYQQATVIGSALLCNEALGINGGGSEGSYEVAKPMKDRTAHYEKWLEVRNSFRKA